MRLIDGDELIERWAFGMYDTDDGTIRQVVAVKAIEDMPNIAPRDWKPCAEGLPEEHEQTYPVYDEQTFAVIDARYEMVSDVCAVTVKSPNGAIFSAVDLTVNGKWETYERMEEDHTVVAWQPLPAPYRADDTMGKVKED